MSRGPPAKGQALILQHFKRDRDSPDALGRLLAIVAPTPSFSLDYDDLGDALQTVGDAAFLAAPDRGGIFELNPVGLAIWEILAGPARAAQGRGTHRGSPT